MIDRGTAESDEDINLTGFVIHSAVHAARTDVHCVMHSHSPGGIAVSALKDGLVPMTIDAMTFYECTAYHDFEGLSVDIAERERMAANQVLGTGQEMALPNAKLCQRAAEQSARFPPGKYEWPALKRLVKEASPDYCE